MDRKIRLIRSSALTEGVSERDVQKTFEHQMGDLEDGLKFVCSFPTTNVGVIDTVALDEDQRPVVIEFKGPEATSHDAFIQALDYTVWCRNNFSWLEKTIRSSLADTALKVSNDIRIIVVAPDFDERVKRAAYGLDPEIKLISYKFFEHDDEMWILPIVEVDTSIGGSRIEVLPPKTKDQHFEGLPDAILSLYEKLEVDVKKIGDDIEINSQPQGYIGFRNINRNFLWVHPKRKWIRLDLWLTSEEAKTNDYRWEESWGGSGYFHLTNETYEEGLRLVRAAYEKTRKGA